MKSEPVVGMPGRIHAEVHQMCQRTVEMLKLTWRAFKKQDTGPLEAAEQLGREIHRQEKALTELVVKKPAGQADAYGADQELFFVPMHLERIGDNIELLVKAIRTMVQEGIPFTERGMREINTLFEKAVELVECVRDVVPTKNGVLIRYLVQEGQQYEKLASEYALFHQQRLIEGVCMPKASSVYVAILDYLRGIEWHTRQIAQKCSEGAAS